jgi:hypothetical protein
MPWWRGPALIAAAAIVTFLLSAIVVRWAGGDPISAFRYMFISPLQTKFGFTESILSATPLVFTGAAATRVLACSRWARSRSRSREFSRRMTLCGQTIVLRALPATAHGGWV